MRLMMTHSLTSRLFGAALGASLLLGASPAAAQDYEDYEGEGDYQEEGATAEARAAVARMRAIFAREPQPRETAIAALRYFRVHPEALDALRSKARLRALMPSIQGSYRYADATSAEISRQTPTPVNTDQNFARRDDTASVNASWNLPELVFNGDVLQVYGLVGVQRDLMLEVLRAYFARRQLALTVELRPPADAIALASLVLRIDEFTATLDLLTGGWFGDRLADLEDEDRERE